MQRRQFLTGATALTGVMAAAGLGVALPARAGQGGGPFEVTLTEAEWRARLTELQYLVLREHETERAFTSPLNAESRPGLYHCAGCDLPAFDAADKYDSGTGWPSFTRALPGATGTRPDRGLFGTRTEVHCRRCGGHFGHVFDDGPAPTGKRWCMNGAALTFRPAA